MEIDNQLSDPLAITFREIIKMKLKVPDLARVLHALEGDLESYPLEKCQINHIAVYIHHLYQISNVAIHGCLIRIIAELEFASKESIIEKYKFDYLVAESLDQKPPDPQPKIDEEKNSVFKIISLLLKLRKRLPISILRAMVSLYQTPKHNYKPLLLAYMASACLACQNVILSIPEIPQILIDNLMETGNTMISSLISYSIENFSEFTYQKHFFSHLVLPFCSLKKDANLEFSIKAISNIMYTWPGQLHVGFKENVLYDLLQCIQHQTDSVVSILRNLLNIHHMPTILDSYHGFLLHNLIKIGLIPKLHKVADNQSASAFLNNLASFISNDKTIDLIPTISHESKIIEQSCDSLTFKLSRFVDETPKSNQLQTVTINDPMPDDREFTWDWNMIYKLLAVVLPHDQKEATSPQSKAIYQKLLDFYANQPSKQLISIKSDSLVALCSLLMSSWGMQIIDNHAAFIKTLCASISEITTAESPDWAYFRCVMEFMKSDYGTVFLQKNKIGEILLHVDTQYSNVERIKEIISYIDISTHIGSHMYMNFLRSKSQEIQLVIVDSFRTMINAPYFQQNVYEKIIVTHIKKGFEIPCELKLLTEVFLSNKGCLESAARDPEMHQILQKKSRFLYSLLYGVESGFNFGNCNDEFKWWIETGNNQYVKYFDDESEKAFTTNEHVSVPIHLFGQLCKTKIGRDLVVPSIPSLLEKLENGSNYEKRAIIFALAHFGSNKESAQILKEYNVIQTFMKCLQTTNSYVLKGTIITSLSLIAESKYLFNVLEEYNWVTFKFGNHYAIVPNNISTLYKKYETIDPPLYEINDIPGQEKMTSLIRQLSSPISQKQAKAELHNIYQNDPKALTDTNLALYSSEMMSKFVVSPDNRFFLIRIFSHAPLLPLELVKNLKISEDIAAPIRARLYLFLATSSSELCLSMITIPQYSLNEAKSKKICPECPEVFINNDDFSASFGMKKEDFYSLPSEEMTSIRQRILN